MDRINETAPDVSRNIVLVRFTDIEKRYRPLKHYVYIMRVTWSCGSEETIYRKFSEFFDLYMTLTKTFPEESGKSGTKCQIIPSLSGKKKDRKEVRHIASKRMADLEEYCRRLINLDPRISLHNVVITFFEQRESDRNPPVDAKVNPSKSRMMSALALFTLGQRSKNNAVHSSTGSLNISGPIVLQTYRAIADYKGTEEGEVSFHEDDLIDIIEKKDNGWWLVEIDDVQGWAPASYLQPCDEVTEPDQPEPLYNYEQHLAVEEYAAVLPDEVSMKKGAIVNVMHKLLDGWWIVHLNGQVGYAPATYLVPYTPRVPGQIKQVKAQVGENILDMVSRLSKGKQFKKPSQRRCSIKSRRSSSTGRQNSQSVLQMYRKMSLKMNQKLLNESHSQASEEPVDQWNTQSESTVSDKCVAETYHNYGMDCDEEGADQAEVVVHRHACASDDEDRYENQLAQISKINTAASHLASFPIQNRIVMPAIEHISRL